jgi:prophage regulatory protein
MAHFLPLAKEAFPALRVSKSKGYLDISRGLLPPPIKTGPRAAAFLAHEVQALIAARAAGLSDGAMRMVVADLEFLRGNLAGLTEAALLDTTASIVRKYSARGLR